MRRLNRLILTVRKKRGKKPGRERKTQSLQNRPERTGKTARSETNRRRALQEAYNQKHNITPKTIQKSVRETIKATIVENISSKYEIGKDETIEDIIKKLTDEMLKHASQMEFEKAAELRDKIKELEKLI